MYKQQHQQRKDFGSLHAHYTSCAAASEPQDNSLLSLFAAMRLQDMGKTSSRGMVTHLPPASSKELHKKLDLRKGLACGSMLLFDDDSPMEDDSWGQFIDPAEAEEKIVRLSMILSQQSSSHRFPCGTIFSSSSMLSEEDDDAEMSS